MMFINKQLHTGGQCALVFTTWVVLWTPLNMENLDFCLLGFDNKKEKRVVN